MSLPLTHAVVFAVVLPTLLVAHTVADHWVQSGHQAGHKGLPGWTGRWNCAKHVATYTAVTAIAVGLVWWLLRLPVAPAGFVAGQLVSAVTHYWADRRTTLAALARRLGKGEFYALGAPRRVIAAASADPDMPLPFELHLRDAATGRELPWDNPNLGTGAYQLDQSWHWLWLLAAALLTALITL